MKICFATWELSGINPGGIGVVIGNYLKTYSDCAGVEFHILWYGAPDKIEGASLLYPGVTFHCVDTLARTWRYQENRNNRSRSVRLDRSIDRLDAQDQAISIMLAVKTLSHNSVYFDVLEFPDFSGPAYAVIMERTLGTINCIGTLAVRIHSTETALRGWDHRPFSGNNHSRSQLERYCLQNCDLVISHIPSVTKSVQHLFRLPDQWASSVCHETPPVLINGEAPAPPPKQKHRNLAFTSKIQWFKRPDQFIRGAVRFMLDRPDYRGQAVLSAHVISAELEDYCRAIIPDELKSRFIFEDKLSPSERNNLIAGSICVFTSDYESFCLAAYEASLLGALVVLNKDNPAFSEDTTWVHGENCIAYSGGVSELSAALEVAITSEISLKPNAPKVASEPSYFSHLETIIKKRSNDHNESVATVSIVVIIDPNYDGSTLLLPGFKPDRLNADKIIFVYSRGGKSQALIDASKELLDESPETKKYITFKDAGPAAPIGEMLNRGIAEATSEYCIVQSAGNLPEPEFCRLIGRLSKDSGVKIVLPQVEQYNSESSEYETKFQLKALSLPAVFQRPEMYKLEFAIDRNHSNANPFSEDMDEYTLAERIFESDVTGPSVILTQSIGFLAFFDRQKARGKRVYMDMLLARINDLSFMGQKSLVQIMDIGADFFNNEDVSASAAMDSAGVETELLRKIDNEKYHWSKVAARHPLKYEYWIPLRLAQTDPKSFDRVLRSAQHDRTSWKKVRLRHPFGFSKWIVAKALQDARRNL